MRCRRPKTARFKTQDEKAASTVAAVSNRHAKSNKILNLKFETKEKVSRFKHSVSGGRKKKPLLLSLPQSPITNNF
jgi:hypothetical protein